MTKLPVSDSPSAPSTSRALSEAWSAQVGEPGTAAGSEGGDVVTTAVLQVDSTRFGSVAETRLTGARRGHVRKCMRAREGRGGYGGIASSLIVRYIAPVAERSPMAGGLSEVGTAELLRAASRGDQRSWNEVVRRYAGLIWSVARGYNLEPSDAADVEQTVWLRLVENITMLRNPSGLAGWLTTVTKRESLHVLRQRRREVPDDDFIRNDLQDDAPPPESHVTMLESREQIWTALTRLPHKCQVLLRALASVADHQYHQIADALGMPVGSIGPTRSRCLAYLRRELAAVDAR